jgi:hypothetical protein
MRRVKSFSAGSEFARIVFEDKTTFVVRKGDDWDGPTSELLDLERQRDDLVAQLDRRRVLLHKAKERVKQLTAHAEEVEEQLQVKTRAHEAAQETIRDLQDYRQASELDGEAVTIEQPDVGLVSRYVVADAVCREHNVSISPTTVEFAETRELGVSQAIIWYGNYGADVKVYIVVAKPGVTDELAAAANEKNAAALEGRPVTIRRHAQAHRPDQADSYVNSASVAAAIEEEHGIKVSNVTFTPTSEFSVFDADVSVGSHHALVKVWIVKDESPRHPTLEQVFRENDEDCQTSMLECLKRVVRLVRATATHEDISDVIACCDGLLGE